MKMNLAFLILILSSLTSLYGQDIRIDPPNWWTGMANTELQLMLHGDGVGQTTASIDFPGVTLNKTTTTENPNYLFLDLTIAPDTKPGTMRIRLQKSGRPEVLLYELKERKERSMPYGLDGNDFIYLIMPDRFANGNPDNDILPSLQETTIDRGVINARHGGDLQGIIQKLDYLKDLGVTATWLTPPLENNQPKYSYHGYAATDHYQLDPRIGDLNLYRTYVQDSHAKGMQVVFDVVHNHVGDQHYFIRDMPSKDWVNQWDTFTRTNYRTSSLMDMYASEYDQNLMTNGWFDTQMPDLNQRNPLVANYLIQNNIWWIEEMQVDAFRLDTYSYSDQDFLSQWAAAIDREYPGFTMFAEVWVHGMAVQGFYNGNNNLKTAVNTHLTGVLDFELNWSFSEVLNGPVGWESGVGDLYLKLAQDYIYGENGGGGNVIFLDNHDMSRFFHLSGNDPDSYEMAIGILLTMRGIPQWFYGSEIGMDEPADPMDRVREDFPGGWPGDSINKFQADGRTETENRVFNYIKTLARWRSTKEVFSKGKLMQWVPDKGIYVYFRYTDNACVMVAVNSNTDDQTLVTDKFAERMKGYATAINPVTGDILKDLGSIPLRGRTTTILELQR